MYGQRTEDTAGQRQAVRSGAHPYLLGLLPLDGSHFGDRALSGGRGLLSGPRSRSAGARPGRPMPPTCSRCSAGGAVRQGRRSFGSAPSPAGSIFRAGSAPCCSAAAGREGMCLSGGVGVWKSSLCVLRLVKSSMLLLLGPLSLKSSLLLWLLELAVLKFSETGVHRAFGIAGNGVTGGDRQGSGRTGGWRLLPGWFKAGYRGPSHGGALWGCSGSPAVAVMLAAHLAGYGELASGQRMGTVEHHRRMLRPGASATLKVHEGDAAAVGGYFPFHPFRVSHALGGRLAGPT